MATRATIPLWLKLLVGALLLAVIPTVVIGTMSYQRSREVLEAHARTSQVVLSENLNDKMRTIFDGAKRDMYSVARLLTRSDLADEPKLALILAEVSASESLDNVDIYDAHGVLIDRMLEQRDLQVPPTAPTWKIVDLEHVDVGAAIAMKSEVRVPIAMMVVDRDNVTTGILVSYISLAAVQSKIDQLSVEQLGGQPRTMLLLDRQLRAVAATTSADTIALANQSAIGLLQQGNGNLVDNAVLTYGPEYSDIDGTTMIGTLRPVLGWPFSLLVQQPRDIVYADAVALRRTTIIIVTVAIAIAALLAFGFARAVTSPIRSLVSFTKSLAARKFSQRVQVKTRDELSLLADALNQSAKDLGDSEVQIKREHEIRADLGRYLPAPIVDRVVARQQDMGLGGKRRSISVVFADVVGFTPLTGKLEPEVVVSILNELFTIMSEIVFRHEGMIDKFIGDSMMAIWGAPEPTTDHAERAVAAALDMQKWLEFGRKRWKDRYDISIDVAIGINSGDAVVGNIGSQTRMEYTAIGEAVNVAARVESVARPRQVLITAATKSQLPDTFDIVEIGEKQLPGREVPTMLYEVTA
jgi:adenylate cyclase